MRPALPDLRTKKKASGRELGCSESRDTGQDTVAEKEMMSPVQNYHAANNTKKARQVFERLRL